ncbi:hypothetical protein [Kitasatospora sp. NPDC098663]|uniref:hypothetical protein n=1 Tax=Kitasatospora sp. NPDC098663 TaxID=3364096 RepID=UPI00381870DA
MLAHRLVEAEADVQVVQETASAVVGGEPGQHRAVAFGDQDAPDGDVEAEQGRRALVRVKVPMAPATG